MATSRKRAASRVKGARVSAPSQADVEAQLASFVAKFDPAIADCIRAYRAALRNMLPTAVEVVYDNYNFFVIGYSPTARPSDTILSLAAGSNGVGLSSIRIRQGCPAVQLPRQF